MDKELEKIIKEALDNPNPKCPNCGVEGKVKGYGEIAWCECPRCGQKIGRLTIM